MIGVIFIGYFLYFIRFYPAIMTPDSYYVIHYANNFILSDYHTFGHTWFFGIFFHLGKFLFHSLSKSIAFSTLVQMLCMSLIFSTSIRYFYNKGLNKKICIFLTLFFAFNPLHAHYSITLWRDIMFGGSFLLILICLYEFISSKSKIKIAYIILFIIGVLIMLFFRNNGIYVYLFCIPFIIGFMKNKRIMMSIITISIACFYFVIKGPVFDYFNIEKTTSVEAFSIPLQQIARVIALDKNITAKDEKYLKIVDKKSNSDDIIDIGDIIKIKFIYDIDDIEEYTIKLTGKYMIDNNAKIKEVSLNSPIGRSIYLKSINDNDICYYVNDKKIGIKIIKRIYEN